MRVQDLLKLLRKDPRKGEPAIMHLHGFENHSRHLCRPINQSVLDQVQSLRVHKGIVVPILVERVLVLGDQQEQLAFSGHGVGVQLITEMALSPAISIPWTESSKLKTDNLLHPGPCSNC